MAQTAMLALAALLVAGCSTLFDPGYAGSWRGLAVVAALVMVPVYFGWRRGARKGALRSGLIVLALFGAYILIATYVILAFL